MKQSRNMKLATNLFLYFISMFLPKIFSFFLVPFYTSYLSTEEYGISDLVLNTASLILPVLSLNINSAVLRFTIENKGDRRPYHIGIQHYYISNLILGIILCFVSCLSDLKKGYLIFIFLIYASSALSEMQMCYIRAQERMKLLTFCGVGSSLVSLLCNVLFIAVFPMGAYGFLISTVAGYLFNVMITAREIWKDGRRKTESLTGKSALRKEMIKYSAPLVVSGITWWIYSASDRYFVTGMCGTSENGVYSVGYKIPTMLQTVVNLFGQAWIFSLYDLYKTEDGKTYIAKVYDVYHFVLSVGCSILITADIFLAKILYAKEFFPAWRYVPPLLLSILFTAMGAFMGSFQQAYKKTNYVAVISTVTAITNIVLNYVLIVWSHDAMGAAVATAVTSMLSFGINFWIGIKLSGVRVPMMKHFIIYAFLIIQSIMIICTQNVALCFIMTVILIAADWKNCIWAYEKGKHALQKFFIHLKTNE